MICIESPDFSSLAAPLRHLFDSALAPSIFDVVEWYDVVSRYGTPPGVQPWLYADDAAKCALIGLVNLRARRLYSCVTPYSCDYSPIFAAGSHQNMKCLRELICDIIRARHGFVSVRLSGLDSKHSSFAAIMEGFHDAGFLARPYFCWGVWYEDVQGCDFATYLSRRPTILRNTWRRKLAAFERVNAYEWVVYRAGADIDSLINEYEAVHARSWKPREPFPKFMPALIATAAKLGTLRMGILRVNGTAIAAQVWLLWRGRATIFKLAYSEDWARHSPGTLLTMHMVQDVLAHEEVNEINFGRGDDDYKKLWLSQRRECWGIEAERRYSLRGAMLVANQLRRNIRRLTRSAASH